MYARVWILEWERHCQIEGQQQIIAPFNMHGNGTVDFVKWHDKNRNMCALCCARPVKRKAIPLQALTGREGSSSLRLPDVKTIGTLRWQGYLPYAPAAFTPRKYSWYSFLLESESTPGIYCGRKDYVKEKFKWHHRESIPRPSGL
jgi:hypothetical protein